VGFDQIEMKLRKIEDRLVQLKNQSPSVVKVKYSGSGAKSGSIVKEENCVVSAVKEGRKMEIH
jgi:hypothetical protein